MKIYFKLIALGLFLSCISNTVFSQYKRHYSLSLYTNYANSSKNVTGKFSPAIGFYAGENVSLGSTLNFNLTKASGANNTYLFFNPTFFARYWFELKNMENLFLFVQAQSGLFNYTILDPNKSNVNTINIAFLSSNELRAGGAFKIKNDWFLETGLYTNDASKFYPFLTLQYFVREKAK